MAFLVSGVFSFFMRHLVNGDIFMLLGVLGACALCVWLWRELVHLKRHVHTHIAPRINAIAGEVVHLRNGDGNVNANPLHGIYIAAGPAPPDAAPAPAPVAASAAATATAPALIKANAPADRDSDTDSASESNDSDEDEIKLHEPAQTEAKVTVVQPAVHAVSASAAGDTDMENTDVQELEKEIEEYKQELRRRSVAPPSV